jgi:hypothetical protein
VAFEVSEEGEVPPAGADIGAAVDGAERAAGEAEAEGDGLDGFAGDHIDDTADGVGTVERGGGAFGHFDPLELAHVLTVEVDDAALDAARAGNREAVLQDEDLARVDSFDLLGAGRSGGSAAGDDAGNFAENVGDTLIAGVEYLLAGGGFDLGGRFFLKLFDARAGDDGDLLRDLGQRQMKLNCGRRGLTADLR